MPTPVSTARQCLTDEAARALDDAVAVARRRSHAQTTSFHAVSAFLAPPSSILRDACTRAGRAAYSPRLQLRALELSVGVSLDRLPTSRTVSEAPPVSNSLMAAIKRSQANQRRHPESFHLHQIQNQQATSLSSVRVELKHFILSILDDPNVSRVLLDAGFRSYDIKLAIVRPPPPPISRVPMTRRPPLFLCNLPGGDSDPGRSVFRFPFSGVSLSSSDGDENCRRIAAILGKDKGRNPLLVGFCAADALCSFDEFLKRETAGVLPSELTGLATISIDKEILLYVNEGGSEEMIGLKFKEVGQLVDNCSGPGIVVNYGEMKQLNGDGKPGDAVNFVVSKLTDLLNLYGRKIWLIGSAESDEAYLKLLTRFPSIQKDWDLNLLPITSSSKSSIDGFLSKPSLMGSFIPFGGFFSTPSDFSNPLIITNQSQPITRCHLCNEKYEQEVSAMREGSIPSVADQCSASLPPWLQMAELDSNKGLDTIKATNDGLLFNAKVMGLQKKWNDICQRCHHMQSFPKLDISQSLPQVSNMLNLNESPNKSNSNLKLRPMDLQCDSATKLEETQIRTTLTSITTDLGLGTLYAFPHCQQPKKSKSQDPNEKSHSFSGSNTSQFDVTTQSCMKKPYDFDPKCIRRVLAEMVSWQNEAISAISETVSNCRNGYGSNLKGNIWLSFVGPDKVGKKKIAEGLAKLVFGRQENVIWIDMNFQQLDDYGVKLRGKTVVDYIAEALMEKPQSVVYLENVDKADLSAQKSLSYAIKTGKFPDSHGREISINNMIFVVTSDVLKGDQSFLSCEQQVEYSEERLLRAKCKQMQISVEKRVAKDDSSKKRKLIEVVDSTGHIEQHHKKLKACLDLNLPVEDDEEIDGETYVSDSMTENSEAWLETFFDQMDERVVFKSFDFNSLAEKILEEIKINFEKTIEVEKIQLEIQSEVMDQLLAAVWLSEGKTTFQEWVEHVLARGFLEAKQRYDITAESVLKLLSCEGASEKVHSQSLSLPDDIIIK